MQAPTPTATEYACGAIKHIISDKYGLELDSMNAYADHSVLYNYKIRLVVFSYFNLSKYLKISHKERHNLYYFDFELDFQLINSNISCGERIVQSAISKVLNPLFEALEEFNFDKEVDKLLISEYN